MRKMLLLAIATMGATALMAAPSEARPWHDHERREVERQVIVQPIPGVQVQLPVRVERPVERPVVRKRVIVVHERDRHHPHYYEHHGWQHHRPHREVIVVRR
ncbi:hypothetical protein D3C86_994910 [compost metagenome]